MINDKIIGSYLSCKSKAYRKFNNEQGIKTEFEILQEEQLSMCKTEFYNRLLEKYGENNLLKGYNFRKNRRIPRTDVIIQPTLYTEAYQISFDAIEIIPDKKSNSKKMKIPILISPKEKISKIEKLSIAIKCVILSKVCGIDYEFGRIIYGPEFKTLKFKIEPFLMEAKRNLDELNRILKEELKPMLFQKSHCKICEFQDECIKELIDEDSLGLLRRMDEKEIRRYNNKGIFTVKQLSYAFKPRKPNRRIKARKHPYYFALQALAIREQKAFLYDKKEIPNTKIKVFIDMEGNSDGSFIYLIGILIVEEGKERRHILWANDFKDENEIFNECIKILMGLNDVHIFHYGGYESRVFKRMLKSNSTEKVKNLLVNKSTNILSVIYSNLYFPTYSNGLKDIGKYLGCSWSTPNSSGIQSIVWRKKWERSKDTKLKGTLITYNFEDCIALKTLTKFIFKIFDSSDVEKSNNKLQNIAYVKDIKIDDGKLRFKNMEYFSKDIEVINECAYFKYQRNRIYFRTNKNIKKSIQRKAKETKIKYRPNKTIVIEAKKCTHCNSKDIVIDNDNFYSRISLDLCFLPSGVKRWIILYHVPYHFCSFCKKSFFPKKFMKLHLYADRRSKIPKKYIEQKGCGHGLLAWTVHQNVVNAVTFRNMEYTLKDYFGLQIDRRRIWELKFLAAEYYKVTCDRILRKIVKGHLIHADETKLKIGKEYGYVWVFTNMEEVFYLYKPTRESDFLLELLKGFKGVLVTDFYTGYDSLDCHKQKCLVHLIRNLNDALLKNPFDTELKKIVILFGRLLREVIHTTYRYGLKSRYMRKHKKEVERFYKWLSKENFYSELAEKFKKRLIKHQKELFLFLDYDNIPWNNNNAEFAIKHIANYRRFVKGAITKRGLETHLILLSIYQTCNYKGINFLDFLLSQGRDIDKFMEKH